MRRALLTRQRLAGAFLGGLALFYSPLLSLFDRSAEWAGIPLSYLYLFGGWLAFIVLTAWIVEGSNR